MLQEGKETKTMIKYLILPKRLQSYHDKSCSTDFKEFESPPQDGIGIILENGKYL